MKTAYQAAEALQTAYCKAKRRGDNFFCVSNILGSDWCDANPRDPKHYKQMIIDFAEMRFGELPFYPFSDGDD